MNKYSIFFIFLLTLILPGCTKNSSMDIPAVQNFIPEKYFGKWYEYARLPNSFEHGMSDCYAIYAPGENDNIIILNCGMKEKKFHCVTAIAKSVIPGTGELKVSFFRPFYARYRIIKLMPDYSFAVVTGKDKSFLWILSREKYPEHKNITEIINFLREHKYPVEKLIYPQTKP